MTQKELERNVSDQTGESIETIQRLGFSLLSKTIPIEGRQEPLVIDWDLEDRIRNSSHLSHRNIREFHRLFNSGVPCIG